ncbi:MAG: class I SAM-dependent methyltransferase [Mycoplasmatales bacterium]
MKQAGHLFLKSLGKKRLRPGGKEATNWLLNKANIQTTDQVLEVACNMGTTLIQVAKTYNCQITGVDLSKQAVIEANENIQKSNLTNAQVIQGNAFALPFEDNTFDVIINEAMLTMLPYKNKKRALTEYYRVLKPGGRLITHDMSTEVAEQNTGLSQTVNVPVNALSITEWQNLFKEANLSIQATKHGKLTLLSPRGLIYDEGVLGALKIIKNSRKKANKAQFKAMYQYFNSNKQDLNYIATYSQKPLQTK